MKQKIFFLVMLTGLACCYLSATSLAAAKPLRVHLEKGVSETVAVGKQTADMRRKWQVDQRQMADENHALEIELKLLKARSRKLQGYNQQRQQEIAKLKAGLDEMAEIGLRLEPYLDELVQRVKTLQGKDLPFATAERERRLADLDVALKSYDIDLAEKLRRVMETLKIEAGFGRGFEVGEETIERDETATTVRVLRLGRVGLYYLTLDGTQAGWFDRTRKTWEELPGTYSEAVKEALRMALKQRAFDLVQLPVAGGKP